jgi:peptidylprolyl isomerase
MKRGKMFGAALAAVLGLYIGFEMGVNPVDAQTPVEVADTANWRAVDPENLLIFDTSKGRIYIELAPEFAPGHVARIREVVRAGWYANTPFHRVIADFMAQGGDAAIVHPAAASLAPIAGEFTLRRDASMELDLVGPRETARFGWYKGFPVSTQSEFLMDMSPDRKVETFIRHCKGVASMARTSDPDSATDQFFIMRSDKTHLDAQYTAWGRVLLGQDVVDRLSVGEPPRVPDRLISASVASDLPTARRPQAWVKRTDGPHYALIREEADRRAASDVCALGPVPAHVVDPVTR